MKYLALLCFLILGACASLPVYHDTESGKPEVVISKSDAAGYSERLTAAMVAKGQELQSATQHRMIFEETAANPFVGLLSGGNGKTALRVIYQFMEEADHIRVIADVVYVTNAGGKNETLEDMTNAGPGKHFQRIMKSALLEAN